MTRLTVNPGRRRFLQGAAATGIGIACPCIAAAQDNRSLKVSAFGGYFEDSLVKHVYPKFTKETGIAIESVSQAGGTAWWTAIRAGMEAGAPPADVSMPGGQGAIRFQELFTPLDESRMPNIAAMNPRFITRDAQGRPTSIAVLAWYTTFVTNTETYPNPPTSWADLWSDTYAGSLGLNSNIDSSYLLDITAVTFFGGQDILRTREGIAKVMDKAAELKPNVSLWYQDEGQFQQALQSGEIPAGQYYHDVTLLAAADGFPVTSTFPKEGGVIDFGGWAVIKGSKRVEEGTEFANWCCSPEVQALMTEAIGTAPILPREKLSISDEAFAAASSDIAPIVPAFDVYVEHGDWMSESWAEILSG